MRLLRPTVAEAVASVARRCSLTQNFIQTDARSALGTRLDFSSVTYIKYWLIIKNCIHVGG